MQWGVCNLLGEGNKGHTPGPPQQDPIAHVLTFHQQPWQLVLRFLPWPSMLLLVHADAGVDAGALVHADAVMRKGVLMHAGAGVMVPAGASMHAGVIVHA